MNMPENFNELREVMPAAAEARELTRTKIAGELNLGQGDVSKL